MNDEMNKRVNEVINSNELNGNGVNSELNNVNVNNTNISEEVLMGEQNDVGAGEGNASAPSGGENADLSNVTRLASASSSAVAGVATAAATAVAAIVGVIAFFNADLVDTADVNLNVNSIQVLDTSLSYDIDASCNEPLILSVYNDFYTYTVPLEDGNNKGTVKGLTESMNYNFVITYKGLISDAVAYKNVVKTLAPIRITEFYEVAWECRCAVDGYFHFLMSFDDDYGYWSSFTATLTDDFSNVSYCEFSENLHEEQKIPVIKHGQETIIDSDGKATNELLGSHAKLKITCVSKEDEQEKTITLYEDDCKI